MSSPLFVPFIALLVLDDTGMTLRCANPIPDISNEEIIGIGNFYSPVVSASSPHLEIYGPLPIPHHEKYHLLIVTFRKNDSLVHDPRAKDKDVLSFCQSEGEEMPDGEESLLLGDVVVCYPQAKRQAVSFKKLLDDEIEFLVLHGVLHLLGIHHD